MSGPVDWQFLLLLAGFAAGLIASAVAVIVWVVRLTWWLSEEFKNTRHSIASDIAAVRLDLERKIEAVDQRDIREHEEMQKHISGIAIDVAKIAASRKR